MESTYTYGIDSSSLTFVRFRDTLSGDPNGGVGPSCVSPSPGIVAAAGCTYVLRCTTSTASACRLTTDGLAANSTNCINIGDGTQYAIRLQLAAMSHTNHLNVYSWTNTGNLHRRTGASETLVLMQAGEFLVAGPEVAGLGLGSVVSTQDTTNGCLSLSFTPPTANAQEWNAVATVTSAQLVR